MSCNQQIVVKNERPAGVSLQDLWSEGWPQTIPDFERLVDAFQHRLMQFAFRRLGRRAEAEDVVQDVFTSAFVERKKRARVSNVGAYLFRMAQNRCLDRQRKIRRHPNVSLEEEQVVHLPARNPDAASLAMAAEELSRIEVVLRRISKPQAEAIRLCLFDDLTTAEAAEVMGCSENTLRSRLRYGFAKLRRIIGKEKE